MDRYRQIDRQIDRYYEYCIDISHIYTLYNLYNVYSHYICLYTLYIYRYISTQVYNSKFQRGIINLGDIGSV